MQPGRSRPEMSATQANLKTRPSPPGQLPAIALSQHDAEDDDGDAPEGAVVVSMATALELLGHEQRDPVQRRGVPVSIARTQRGGRYLTAGAPEPEQADPFPRRDGNPAGLAKAQSTRGALHED